MNRIILAAVALSLAPAGAAHASSAEAIETEGGTVRLVTSGLASPDGTLRGALVVDLQSGWKTYWRDPGATGVAPSIDLSGSINVDHASFGFPAPQWHRDDYGTWAGYDRPVTLPVSFKVPQPDRFSALEAKVFLGICRTICVPVEASFSIEPGSDPDNTDDAATVDAAFAALPAKARPGLRVGSLEREGETLVFAVEAPTGQAPELFVAAPEGYTLTPPAPDGSGHFTARILEQPPQDHGAAFDYTLVAGDEKVSGTIRLP